jgi:hypothetical protein
MTIFTIVKVPDSKCQISNLDFSREVARAMLNLLAKDGGWGSISFHLSVKPHINGHKSIYANIGR